MTLIKAPGGSAAEEIAREISLRWPVPSTGRSLITLRLDVMLVNLPWSPTDPE